MSDELVVWLRAQLDEEMRVATLAAEAACGGVWEASDSGIYPADNPSRHPGPFLADAHGHTDPAYGEHIARHDPARVFVEVAADRRLLDLHACAGTVPAGHDPDWSYCSECGSGEPHEYPTDWPCETIKLRALRFADRPGYREEWRPTVVRNAG